ncbi:hypothetical protein H4R35_003096 [Dimargaris xerosporica]|nr:hypothetical protein H4R35_003096 [Dimargaris xerosporica]
MLKFVKSIKVTFSPYNRTSNSAKVFLNRIMTSKNIATNPDCKITPVISDDLATAPNIQLAFRNGNNMSFNTARMEVDEIVETLAKQNRKLQQDEDDRT